MARKQAANRTVRKSDTELESIFKLKSGRSDGWVMGSRRLESVDVLRGIVMILMALDHTRDFLGSQAVSPTDLSKASAGMFLTRFVTHICAPVFFLLTGTGACLALRSKSRSELSRFLLTRGVWLIILEVTVFRCLAMQFNFDYHMTMLVVLWALGWAMIALSALVYLPKWAVGAIGTAIIAGHNLLDSLPSASFGKLAPLWNILHAPGPVFSSGNHMVFVAYPLIPWVGVTAAGFSLGQVFDWPADRRRKFLLRLGLGLVAAFIVFRAINSYGDPLPWSAQKSPAFTVLSFLNTNKYPPSLLFLLMTLGPAMLLLRALDDRTPQWLRPALVYGRVPLFYFVLHFALIHLAAVVVCQVRFGQIRNLFESPDPSEYPFNAPPGWGFGLPGVYLSWALVVIALYPLCAWFAALKQRRNDAWISYL
jgi:uncharacterized membrane protein